MPDLPDHIIAATALQLGVTLLSRKSPFERLCLNDRQLSAIACDLIVDPANDVLISAASYWEIAIKVSLGKYQLPGSLETWMQHQIQVNELCCRSSAGPGVRFDRN